MLYVEQKNQTNPEWLNAAHSEGGKANARGTGLFVLPDPSKGAAAIQKVIVPELTYQECVARGYSCVAFKWIPETVASAEVVNSWLSQALCKGFPCTNSVQCDKISLGCFCVLGVCS